MNAVRAMQHPSHVIYEGNCCCGKSYQGEIMHNVAVTAEHMIPHIILSLLATSNNTLMMAGSSLSRINGLGEFCMPADGCRGRCAKHKPCRIADRYGCRWKLLTSWSFALYVSFSFLLLHLFCCIRTYGLHCPRPCAIFRGYSPPVAINVVVFQ